MLVGAGALHRAAALLRTSTQPQAKNTVHDSNTAHYGYICMYEYEYEYDRSSKLGLISPAHSRQLQPSHSTKPRAYCSALICCAVGIRQVDSRVKTRKERTGQDRRRRTLASNSAGVSSSETIACSKFPLSSFLMRSIRSCARTRTLALSISTVQHDRSQPNVSSVLVYSLLVLISKVSLILLIKFSSCAYS